MSTNVVGLHSHSALERDLNYPKHLVLVDEDYLEQITGSVDGGLKFKEVKANGRTYIEVPIMLFVRNGGTFRNLSK